MNRFNSISNCLVKFSVSDFPLLLLQPTAVLPAQECASRDQAWLLWLCCCYSAAVCTPKGGCLKAGAVLLPINNCGEKHKMALAAQVSALPLTCRVLGGLSSGQQVAPSEGTPPPLTAPGVQVLLDLGDQIQEYCG